jgi:hypothetical protein
MGFFNKPEDVNPSAGGLAPLTRDRIEAALKSRSWNYQIDSDGDIGGIWDNNVFYFFQYGEQKEILQIRGRWNQALPIELRPQALLAIDEWHLTKIWPKGYTRVDDQGRLWVHSEHSVDWEHGVTDEQLILTIQCGITTSLSMYRFLAEKFPTQISSVDG